MWTNEFLSDKSVTTVLDDTGEVDDVILTIDDDGYAFIEQYSESEDLHLGLIVMPPKMFSELIKALNSPEGAFRSVR